MGMRLFLRVILTSSLGQKLELITDFSKSKMVCGGAEHSFLEMAMDVCKGENPYRSMVTL